MRNKFLISVAIPAAILLTSNFALACGCGCMGASCGASNVSSTQVEQTQGKVQCPVMKNWFISDDKTEKAEYKGKTYFFCCAGCKTQFDKDPEKYVDEAGIKS